ncbi:hypothetical protein ACSLFT_28720 [Streptomyces sp. G6]|uniref:hypothetical protein n=1 Tax=Streptomyces sp. G6 TaxID=1178736 RepID=UPI003EDA25E2
MSARDELRKYVHLLADMWTSRETTDARVEELYNAVRAEVLAEAAAVVDDKLTIEPDHTRASALYEVLRQLRAMQTCTCARSGGLHEKSCRKYVPGHELLSPVRALAAYRSERGEES